MIQMLFYFQRLRDRLYKSIRKNGLNSEITKKISKRFDETLNLYYKKERQYNKDNIIYVKYIESINELGKINKLFSKFPSIEEWNKYAKEKELLSSESVKYISGSNWHYLRNRIKIEK